MKLDPSLRRITTFAVVLSALIACQNATEPTNSSGPVVVNGTYTMGSSSRLPDSIAWTSPKDTGSQGQICNPTTLTCSDTFHLSEPLGQDSIAVQLWTLGIRTSTIYFGEVGNSPTLTLKSSFHRDLLDTLLLSVYVNLPSAQQAALAPSNTGRAGLVSYYASLLLSGDTAFVGKSSPVGMNPDSLEKALVYLGITEGKSPAQLTSLVPGLDTGSIRTIAKTLVQANVLKTTDTLVWFHPVRVNASASVSGSLAAGGAAVGVTGSFSWNTGAQVALSRLTVRTPNPGDSSNFQLSYQFNPGKTDTTWPLSGNLTILASATAAPGWDTLVITLSTDAIHSASVRVPFQVLAKDITPPALTILAPVQDTAAVPNATASFVVKAVATDSGSGVDSLKIGSKTIRTATSIADTLFDTLPLVVGANAVLIQAWDHAGNASNASVTITRAPAPVNKKAPSITHVSPTQDTETVPWGTKSATLSWTITGDTTIASVVLNGHPLPGNAGLYQTPVPLNVGLNLFPLVAVDAYGLSAYDTLRITRQGDTSHPVVVRGAGTDDTVLLKSQTSYGPVWTVTDNALDSVTINGFAAIAGNANSYSAPVPVSGDSLWITLVVKDSSGNTSRDSIKVRRLGPPTITPAGGNLSGTQTVTPTISSNLPGAILSYSTSANPSIWTVGTAPFVTSNQVLYAKATVGNVTSLLDSVAFLYIPTPTLSGVTATQATVTIAPAGSAGIEDSLSTGSTWTSYTGSFSVGGNIKIFARSHLGGTITTNQEVDFAIPPTLVPASKDTGVDSVVVSASGAGSDSVQVSLNQQKWITLDKATPAFTVSSYGTLYGRSWVGSAVSAVDSVTVQIYPSAPQFSVSSGTYPFAQTVRMTTIPAGASIYYTTDGSTPTIHSALYSDSLVVGTSKTLKAIAANGAAVTGIVKSATYAVADTNTYGIPWNRSITYGTLTDARDSMIYRTVKIGTQTWMAQNLNYAAANVSFCYGDSIVNCSRFGHLYSTGISNNPILCPDGWHVPADTEWNRLIDFVDSATPSNELKSTSGWDSTGNGIDANGLRALPAGHHEDLAVSSSYGKGTDGLWWSASYDSGSGHEYFWDMSYQSGTISHNTTRVYECSIRCVQNP